MPRRFKKTPPARLARMAASQNSRKYIGVTNNPKRRFFEHQKRKRFRNRTMFYTYVRTKRGFENLLLNIGKRLDNIQRSSNAKNKPGIAYVLTKHKGFRKWRRQRAN